MTAALASIEASRKAEENKGWVIGYPYEPQYFNAEVPMQRVALPLYEENQDKVDTWLQ